MTSSVDQDARRATGEVLERIFREGEPALLVDSPPGAGKTTLVESVVATGVQHLGLRVAVVAPRLEQTYDIVRRLYANYAPMPIQILQSRQRELPRDLAENPAIPQPINQLPPSTGPGAVIGGVDKFVFSVASSPLEVFDLLVCDESYQVAAKDFWPLFHVARQILLVGDPGQLPPLVRSDTAYFEAAPYMVHWPAPKELVSRIRGLPVVRLPASRRLRQDTVDVVQPSLYPGLPFVSAANEDMRRLEFAADGMDTPIDRALDLLGSGATMVALLLPQRSLPSDNVDEEVAELAAAAIRRALERGAAWQGRGPLGPGDIGYADAHVASNAAVGRRLRTQGISSDEVKVWTPEIWQGAERPLMVVKHPLSGQVRLDPFALDPGRFCVMLSRHLLGCLIVGREGVGNAIMRHAHDCAERPMGAEHPEWLGWVAHRSIWSTLERMGRLIRV